MAPPSALLLPHVQLRIRAELRTLSACRLGLERADSASDYAWLDGMTVEQGVVADSAYPHWAWLQPQLANTSGANCVAAWSNYQYERFLGDASSSAQVRSQAFYQTSSADKLFAWGAQACSARFATICAVPATSFPCFPVRGRACLCGGRLAQALAAAPSWAACRAVLGCPLQQWSRGGTIMHQR
jgi:hypothetical protein